jgi:hypothetical protein
MSSTTLRRRPANELQFGLSQWLGCFPSLQPDHLNAKLRQHTRKNGYPRSHWPLIGSRLSHEGPHGVVPFDKLRALDMTMKHLGLYERDNAQPAENLVLQIVLVK